MKLKDLKVGQKVRLLIDHVGDGKDCWHPGIPIGWTKEKPLPRHCNVRLHAGTIGKISHVDLLQQKLVVGYEGEWYSFYVPYRCGAGDIPFRRKWIELVEEDPPERMWAYQVGNKFFDHSGNRTPYNILELTRFEMRNNELHACLVKRHGPDRGAEIWFRQVSLDKLEKLKTKDEDRAFERELRRLEKKLKEVQEFLVTTPGFGKNVTVSFEGLAEALRKGAADRINQEIHKKLSASRAPRFKVGDRVVHAKLGGGSIKTDVLRSEVYEVKFDSDGLSHLIHEKNLVPEPKRKFKPRHEPCLQVGDMARYTSGCLVEIEKVNMERGLYCIRSKWKINDVGWEEWVTFKEVDDLRPHFMKRLEVGDRVRGLCESNAKCGIGYVKKVRKYPGPHGLYFDVKWPNGNRWRHMAPSQLQLVNPERRTVAQVTGARGGKVSKAQNDAVDAEAFARRKHWLDHKPVFDVGDKVRHAWWWGFFRGTVVEVTTDADYKVRWKYLGGFLPAFVHWHKGPTPEDILHADVQSEIATEKGGKAKKREVKMKYGDTVIVTDPASKFRGKMGTVVSAFPDGDGQFTVEFKEAEGKRRYTSLPARLSVVRFEPGDLVSRTNGRKDGRLALVEATRGGVARTIKGEPATFVKWLGGGGRETSFVKTKELKPSQCFCSDDRVRLLEGFGVGTVKRILEGNDGQVIRVDWDDGLTGDYSRFALVEVYKDSTQDQEVPVRDPQFQMDWRKALRVAHGGVWLLTRPIAFALRKWKFVAATLVAYSVGYYFAPIAPHKAVGGAIQTAGAGTEWVVSTAGSVYKSLATTVEDSFVEDRDELIRRIAELEAKIAENEPQLTSMDTD